MVTTKSHRLNNDSAIVKFITTSFFDNGETLTTPRHKSEDIHDIIGFYNNNLIEVTWLNNDVTMAFSFINLPENYVDIDKSYINLKTKLNKVCKAANVKVSLMQSGFYFIAYFTEK